MANYDELDELLKSVREYIERLKTLTEIQETLSQYNGDLKQLGSRCDEIINREKTYSETVSSLDDKYKGISDDIKTVLMNYAKVSSSFELTEVEYKKVDVKLTNFAEEVEGVQKTLDKIDTYISERMDYLYSGLSKSIIDLRKKNETLTNLLVVTLILVVIAVVFGIVSVVLLI